MNDENKIVFDMIADISNILTSLNVVDNQFEELAKSMQDSMATAILSGEDYEDSLKKIGDEVRKTIQIENQAATEKKNAIQTVKKEAVNLNEYQVASEKNRISVIRFVANQIIAIDKATTDIRKKFNEEFVKHFKETLSSIPSLANNGFNAIRSGLSGVLTLTGQVARGIVGAFGGIRDGLATVAKGFGLLAAPLTAIIGIGIQATSDMDEAWSLLIGRQKAALAINNDLKDRQAGYYNVLNATSKEVDQLRKQLVSKNNSLERAQFTMDNSRKKTEGMATSLAWWRKEVAETQAALDKATGSTKTWMGFKEAAGKVTQMSKQAIMELATEIERNSRFTRENVIETAGFASMYTNINANIMPRAIRSALDLASVMGIDVKEAMTMVGQALQDPIKGWQNLTESGGVVFTEQERKKIEALVKSGKLLEAQEIVLKRLKYQFEGAAYAAGGTFAGGLDILRNAFRRFAEPIGSIVVPQLEKLVNAGINFLTQFGSIPGELITSILSFTSLAGVIGLVSAAISLLLTPIGLVVSAIIGIKIAIDNNLMGLGNTFAGIYSMVKPEIEKISTAIKSIYDAFNYKPGEDAGFMDQLGKTKVPVAPGKKKFFEQDGEQAQDITYSQVPGLMKQKMQEKYAENLKQKVTEAASQIISSLKTMLETVGTWALNEGKRLFNEAFKNIFGIDFSTAVSNLQNAFGEGSPGRMVLDGIVNNLKVIFENLKAADWNGFIAGIIRFGGAFILLAALGVTTILTAISGAMKELVNAIAAMNNGDFSKMGEFLLKVAGAIGLIAGAKAAAVVLWGLIAPFIAMASPILVIAGAIMIFVGALKWIEDNTGILSKGLAGWEMAFESLGQIIKYAFLGALITALQALSTLIKIFVIAAQALKDLTGVDIGIGNLAAAAIDVDKFIANGVNVQNGRPANDNSGGGAGFNSAQIVNPTRPVNPVVNNNAPSSNQMIQIDKVIVTKPDDFNEIYKEVRKEANRQSRPIKEEKRSYTYA